MKNVVVGLFDRIEDAERVLAHLASSPLDLDTIQVVHADTDTQRRLGDAAGLPPRRSVRNGIVLGVLAGGGLGFLAALPGVAGDLPLIADLGPLLAMAAGALVGGFCGGAAGAFSENVRLPPEHAEAILTALRDGATVIMVHTENLPTARVIGDLFRAGGSRVFETAPPPPEGEAAAVAGLAFGGELVPVESGLEPGEAATGVGPSLDPDAAPAEPIVPDSHLPYAPPWRRADAGEAPLDRDQVDAGEAPLDMDQVDAGEARLDMDQVNAGEAPLEMDQVAAGDVDAGHGMGDAQPAPNGADGADGSHDTLEAPRAGVDGANAGNGMDAAGDELSDLGLSARVLRPLAQSGVSRVAELRAMAEQGDAALLAVRGIGPSGVTEIRASLARLDAPLANSGS